MGRLPTSLLSIVLQLYLIEVLSADEQILRVQEELRKRHLFYGECSGEITPGLTKSIAHYQQKKGFAPTGRLDNETCASLGILKVNPQPVATPFVVADSGDVRGANGETLPGSLLLRSTTDERGTQFHGILVDQDRVSIGLPGADIQRVQPSPVRPKRTVAAPTARGKPNKEGNPIVLAYRSVDHAIKSLFGDSKKKPKPQSRPKSQRPS